MKKETALPMLNRGFRRDLIEVSPLVRRVEKSKIFQNLVITGVENISMKENQEQVMGIIEYDAEVNSEVYRRLKAAIVEAGVISRRAGVTYSLSDYKCPAKYLEAYDFDNRLRIRVRCVRGN